MAIMETPDWHDKSCSRPDLATLDGIQTCLRCGSFTDLSVSPAPLLPPLGTATDFRLLRLLRGNFRDEIRCDIFVEDLSSLPVYEAISYTWADEDGDDSLSRSVTLSGRPFKVTRNCEYALKRVRSRDDNRIVWIDALCIDQTSPQERGHQVGLMPLIYSRARQVLVYLGEEAVSSDLDSWFIRRNSPELRRYFSRAWVLQELTLARKATLLCGKEEAPWEMFRSFIHLRAVVPVFQLIRRGSEPQPEQLLRLLDIARTCEASDPRDKVYALLGIAIDERSHGLFADYSLSVEQLYINVALHLAQRHGWFAVLSRAGRASNTSRTPRSSLPSWVPDWSLYVNTRPGLIGNTQQLFRTVPEAEVLSEVGVLPYDRARYSVLEDHSLTLSAASSGSPQRQLTGAPQVKFEELYVVADGPWLSRLDHPLLCFSLLLAVNRDALAEDPSSTERQIVPAYKLRLTGDCLQTAISRDLTLVSAHKVAGSLTITTFLDLVCVLSMVLVSIYGEVAGGSFDEDAERLKIVDLIGHPWAALMPPRYTLYSIRLTAIHGFRLCNGIIGSLSTADLPDIEKAFPEPEIHAVRAAVNFEQAAKDELGALWRQKLEQDTPRQATFKEMGPDCDFWMDLNDALWRLMVRMFVWKEVTVKLR